MIAAVLIRITSAMGLKDLSVQLALATSLTRHVRGDNAFSITKVLVTVASIDVSLKSL